MRWLVAILVCLAAFLPRAGAAEDLVDAARIDATIERGLVFLSRDALAWKEKHKCVSCHHAAQIAWTMREAKERGRKVDEPVLEELTKWMAESGNGRVGVPRPEGRPKAFNSKAVYFSLALGAAREPDEASRKGAALMLETVRSDQIDNGSWVAWPETRAPYFGPSDESMTALATLALVAAGRNDPAAKATWEKGIAWLAETKSDDELQSTAIRLVLWSRLERPREEVEALVRRIKERQNTDGGWSQSKEMASDAWATGQALYALASAGVKPDDAAVARGQGFLVRTQRDDGSWPMTSRPTKPGGEGAKNLVPIVGGGSAWGVLGLVRSR